MEGLQSIKRYSDGSPPNYRRMCALSAFGGVLGVKLYVWDATQADCERCGDMTSCVYARMVCRVGCFRLSSFCLADLCMPCMHAQAWSAGVFFFRYIGYRICIYSKTIARHATLANLTTD
jgi:hypothetical protein